MPDALVSALVKVVPIVLAVGILVGIAWYMSSCFAAKKSRIKAFEPVLQALAQQHGLTFSPADRKHAPPLPELVTPPKATGLIGPFAVEIGVGTYKLESWSYLRFNPQVRVHGWPQVRLGFQLRHVPATGRQALEQIKAIGYRAYVEPDGITLRLHAGFRPFRQTIDIDTDLQRMNRAFELATTLVCSYLPVTDAPRPPGQA